MSFEIYRRLTFKGRRWFWRLKASNHRVIAVGGESFHNLNDVRSIIDKLVNETSGAEIVVR